MRHLADISSKLETVLVRLACVRHAASVHSEPGSNSPLKDLLESEQSSESIHRTEASPFGSGSARLKTVSWMFYPLSQV